MSDKFYPPATNLISTDQLPEQANFLKGAITSTLNSLLQKIYYISFAVFYYNPFFFKFRRGVPLGLNLKAEETNMDISDWYSNFRVVDVEYVLDRFLNFIKVGYDNEI